MRSKTLLDSFVAYCEANPDQRFWQALRNWCGWHCIYVTNVNVDEVDTAGMYDTFHWEINKQENMN